MQITERVNAPVTTSRVAGRWVLPGLIAGSAFLGFEMLAGSISTSIWAFPQAVAETIGIGSPTQSLAPLSLLAGIAIHLAFSVGLGILFIAIANRFRLTGRTLVAAGVGYMWAESAISIWLVLHLLVPDTLPVLLAAVPLWASVLGRSGFGVILALMYARSGFSRCAVADDPLDLDFAVLIQHKRFGRWKQLRSNRAVPGADFVHDQRVPLITHGGQHVQAAGHHLASELAQTTRRIHVLVDAE